jgi:predicted RNase H-like HicB family nuclease
LDRALRPSSFADSLHETIPEVTMALWTLHAAYDLEAGVWYTLDCDVPGLVTEGETLERLRDRAVAVMPELIEDNAQLIDEERRRGPHSLRLVAFHESTVPVAA